MKKKKKKIWEKSLKLQTQKKLLFQNHQFSKIPKTTPRTNLWNFFESAIIDSFFQKIFFFIHFYENPSKVLGYQGWDKIDDYPDFQPKITHPKHVSLQCNKSDGAILASRKIAPDREQRSESNFPSNWWSSRLRKWKLSHFTTMELCHCHGCIFFVPLARRRAKKNPVLLEGNQSMVLGSWASTYSVNSIKRTVLLIETFWKIENSSFNRDITQNLSAKRFSNVRYGLLFVPNEKV